MIQKRLIAAMLALVFGVFCSNARAQNDSAEVVIQWNQTLNDTIPATAGFSAIRYYPILNVAIFDAVNSIDRDYTAYHARVSASRGASKRAAAAQAAHDILVALIPASQSAYDAALATQLADIPKGAAQQGARVGRIVARRILELRKDDGWSVVPPPYVLPLLPGLWQPTPPAMAPAAFPQFADVTPYALLTSTQFLPRRPPTLTSDEYTASFIEAKDIGSATSTSRTEDQTLLAHLFAGVGYRTSSFAVWSNVARDMARSRGLSIVDTARLFALVTISMHDGLQTSHTSKFVYGLWRPITAIQRAGEDLNPGTVADPAWTSLLVTPPYPGHAGNMSCIGASAATALAKALGTDAVQFSVTWGGVAPNADVTRKYVSFWQLADEEARSRVYGGIHFTFESLASQESCPLVANYVAENFLLPKSDGHEHRGD
jgi:hypothetical protein